MALPTLNLDDRSYGQLLDVLKSHLPGEEWSDHNPSDPGIALLELLTWLGEMVLYRANRVPAAHREKFLKLLADPPVPVTVLLTLGLEPPRATDFVVPPGLRFATDYKDGRRFVFESYERTTLPAPSGPGAQTGTLRLRAIREYLLESVGKSDGRPNQVFSIAHGPVLLDLDNADPVYDPNPRLKVGADANGWKLRGFLLTKESQANPLPPKHFMVEEFENQIRFGDDAFGAIPPSGDPLLLSYQVLEGPEALIGQGDVKHLLNPEIVPGLVPPETLVIAGSADATGGENFFPAEERVRRGLAEFRDPTRLVTASDFERVVLKDFNAFQETANLAQGLDANAGKVQRAVAVMNRKPPLTAGLTSPGEVTLLVLPRYDESAFDAADALQKAAMVAVTPALESRLLTYLEPRRLITTRVHVAGVKLKALSAEVVAVVKREMNTAAIEATIREALVTFLSLLRGYEDGLGWPLGRTVRRSQLYRVLEDVPGMDHVESLTLAPANASGDVDLGPRELPVWASLLVHVKRA